jgi:hypothetical protein
MLKRCRPEGAPLDEALETAFFSELQSQLAAINRYFQAEADRTVSAYQRATKGPFFLFCYIPLLRCAGPRELAAVADRAYWCRKYARSNAVALRKILKKHDKVCGNARGREFLQQCWCTTSVEGIGLFLHSPLLDELKAVQAVLNEKLAEAETARAAGDAADSELDMNPSVAGGAAFFEGNKGEVRPDPAARPPLPAKATAAETAAAVAAMAPFDGTAAQVPPRAVDHHPAPSSITTSDAHDPAGASLSSSPGTASHMHSYAAHLTRHSPGAQSQSSDGLRGAVPLGYGGAGGGGGGSSRASVISATPSLRAQRSAALAAISESPTCMLDSSDFEWEGDGELSRSASGAAVSALPGHPYRPSPASVSSMTTSVTSSMPLAMPPPPHGPRRPSLDASVGAPSALHGPAVTMTSDPCAVEGVDPDGPREDREDREDGRPLGGSDGASDGMGVGPGPFRDEELRCPICLDIMYKPVGLGCGHKFCRHCALEAAGFGRIHGAFRNIVSYIPVRVACPQCRQPNVYRNAVSLKEVGALIRARYPADWAEAAEEEKRRKREASVHNSKVQRNRVVSMLGTTPFDLINAPTSSAGGSSVGALD